MSWERRPESDTPMAEQREFRDEAGRTWIGTATSGDQEGGEERAQVVFVCRDQPSELRRVARVDVPARDVDSYWRRLGEDEVRDVFRSSEIA